MLRGQIGLDPGIRSVIGVFCVGLWIVVPINALCHRVFPPEIIVIMLLWWGMLEVFYSFGKNDAATILRNLHEALGSSPTGGG